MNSASLPIPGLPLRSLPEAVRSRSGRAHVALLLLTALTALLALRFTLGLGDARLDEFADVWIYHAVMLGAGGLCLARGLAHRGVAWALLGTAIVAWALGSVYWTFFLEEDALPAFSAADVLWLSFYPLACVALVLLRGGRNQHELWLDGLVCSLALGAAGAAILFDVVLDASGGERAGLVAVNLAYPLADLLLIVLVVGALAASGWIFRTDWALIAAGMAIFAISDAVYLYQTAVDSYGVGALVDLGWVAAALMLAWAAWEPRRSSSEGVREGIRGLLFLAGFSLLALGVLVYDHFVRVSELALVAATAALLAVIVRLVLIFREKLELVLAAREEASTDALTGLSNRRRLLADLSARLDAKNGPPALLVLFDLNGFKAYNDTFGHVAGDALLGRVGGRLAAAVAGRGTAYRMGGDEFCVVLREAAGDPEAVSAELAHALAEHGAGFSISAAYGFVSLREEATTPSQALRWADHHMYARKRQNPGSVVAQTTGVLARALAERSPYLEGHVEGVARLADATAAVLGLDPEVRDRVRTAARLHDVGKMAIPESVLEKAGALDEAEWELMRGHTVVGERILQAAPALAGFGAIVRATHERFDGEGYPDGLCGEEIPLEARIICACDAYDALVTGRPYAPSLSAADALAELDRCAGTQFDPAVVAAIAEALAQAAVAAAA